MPQIGPMEIAIVVVLALIVFGPKRLPELGRSLGRGMREFKQSVSGINLGDEGLLGSEAGDSSKIVSSDLAGTPAVPVSTVAATAASDTSAESKAVG